VSLYAVLGVPEGADPAVVRRAYLQLARAHHPDLHPDGAPRRAAERRMQEVNEAWVGGGLFFKAPPDPLPFALACGERFCGCEFTAFRWVELEVLLPQRHQSIPLLAAAGSLEPRGIDHPAKDVADWVVDQQSVEIPFLQARTPQLCQGMGR